MAQDAEVGGNSDSGNNETVKISPLSKKPNVFIEYFTPHVPEKDKFPLIVLAIVEVFS